MRNLSLLLSILILLTVAIGCEETEQSKAKREAKKAKATLVEELKKEYDFKDDCMFNFWISGNNDEVLTAFVCATYWERGITPEDVLSSRNKARMVAAGFEKLEFKRAYYEKLIDLK